MVARKTRPAVTAGALGGVGGLVIWLVVSLANCTTGTTPDCSEAGDMCGPIFSDAGPDVGTDAPAATDAPASVDAPAADSPADVPAPVDAPPE
jgi:hypothetical protein